MGFMCSSVSPAQIVAKSPVGESPAQTVERSPVGSIPSSDCWECFWGASQFRKCCEKSLGSILSSDC